MQIMCYRFPFPAFWRILERAIERTVCFGLIRKIKMFGGKKCFLNLYFC